MPDFVYGTSVFERRRGDFPTLPVKNMVGEGVPVEPGVTLQSRPGLENSAVTMGSGPVHRLYQIDGVLNNGLFGVSGNKFYESSTEIGTVSGSGSVSIAGYEEYVFVNAGEKIHRWNGTTYDTIMFPDDANVTKIAVGASRLIALREDTATFYWSDPLGITIPSLNFATAENEPDKLLDLLYMADRLYLFGSETVETWVVGTDQDLPFTPLPGATFPVGVKSTDCVTRLGRSFAWVTNFNEVCIDTPENLISDPELQVRIEESSSTSLWSFFIDDNQFLALSLDDETWVYSIRAGLWSTFESFEQSNWICRSYENETGYFGTRNSGTLVQWSDTYDDFGDPIVRQFHGWIRITAEPVWLGNVVLRTNPGTTPYLSGEYSNPVVELQTSQDGGKTWMPWVPQPLGVQGAYRTRTIWPSLGQFGYPGCLARIRNSDPVPFRISGLSYNEPFGGI